MSQPGIPTTVEEAEEAIKKAISSDIAVTAMCGILRCHVAMGKSVLDAYKEALRAYIKHADARNKSDGGKK
jgi:hypothetical protein